jgi:hypothetical protein
MRREGAMPLKDLAQLTDDELTRELAITEDDVVREYIAKLLRDRAADDAAARPEIAGLTNAEITELLPSVTDEPVRDALVKVLWTRAARQAQAEHATGARPAPGGATLSPPGTPGHHRQHQGQDEGARRT